MDQTDPQYENYKKAGINNFNRGGENLAWTNKTFISDQNTLQIKEITNKEIVDDCKKAIKAWYDEIKDYDFTTGDRKKTSDPNSMIGHFTCLVWKAYTQFAMGYSVRHDIIQKQHKTNGKIKYSLEISKFITFNTKESTNISGKYVQNVLPLTNCKTIVSNYDEVNFNKYYKLDDSYI